MLFVMNIRVNAKIGKGDRSSLWRCLRGRRLENGGISPPLSADHGVARTCCKEDLGIGFSPPDIGNHRHDTGGLVAIVVFTAVSRSWRERKHRLLVSSLLDFKRREKAKLSMGLGLGQVEFGLGSV